MRRRALFRLPVVHLGRAGAVAALTACGPPAAVGVVDEDPTLMQEILRRHEQRVAVALGHASSVSAPAGIWL